jgi:uncharacterized membrane protein YqhA
MLSRILPATRYLISIAVLGSLAAATTLLFYGALEIGILVSKAFGEEVSSKGAKALALGFIEVIDLFLLATVLYITALGLYELFIDDTLKLPAWLEVHNLDDLKGKLTSVVIVVMGVIFLGQVVTWDGERNLLPFGAAIALVIAALTAFLTLKPKKDKGGGDGDP